ncbi:MAG: hypothetical protein L6V35_03545 [Alistipes putredinis]|nr:MAG: hypothetical protein L6V35_03545 [Alistipes putredinis]
MIGTNNLSVHDSDEQIIEGLEQLTSAIAKRRPEAEIELFRHPAAQGNGAAHQEV